MLEELILLMFCGLVAVAGVGVAVWEAASGRLFSIDALWLTLISLALAAALGWNVAWSFRNGDVRRILNNLRKRSAESEAEAASAEKKSQDAA